MENSKSWSRVAARVVVRARRAGSPEAGMPPLHLTRVVTSHSGQVSDDTLAVLTRLLRVGAI